MEHTSEEQRWSIIATWKQLRNITATAKAVGTSRKAVRRWVQRYAETSSVAPKPKPGRPQSLTAAGAETAHNLLLSEDSTGAAHVAQQLHHQGISGAVLHKATIIRHARRVAAKKGVPIRAARGRPAGRA
jgi:transposase